MVEDLRLELKFRGNRPRVLAAGRILYGAEHRSRTDLSALQVRRIAVNACKANHGAKTENRTLVYSLPRNHPPTERSRLEPNDGIEPSSPRYECGILPLN